MAHIMKKRLVAVKGGTHEVDCYEMRLYVGNVQERFLIHEEANGDKILSDLRTGMKFGSISQTKLLNFRSYYSMTDRKAAESLIASAIAIHGIDKVRAQMRKFPTINEI